MEQSRATTKNIDSVLELCRKIYNSKETESAQYPGDQKDYDKGWINRLDKIMSYIEGGDRNIYEILARLRNFWMSGRWQIGEMADFTIDGKIVSLLARSGYVYYRNAVADAIIGASRKDTVAVIELGSGNGETTFWVWGEGRLRRQHYYTCEFSEAGRRTTRLLAALDDRLKIEPRFFDYRRPNFDGIRFDQGHVLVFSTHSIEQVSSIPDELIDRLCAIAPSVTGLHFEPIGWQFADNPSAPHVIAHKERCREFNYNDNFWDLLKRYEAKGMINVTEATPYFNGFLYNPTCKLVWERLS